METELVGPKKSDRLRQNLDPAVEMGIAKVIKDSISSADSANNANSCNALIELESCKYAFDSIARRRNRMVANNAKTKRAARLASGFETIACWCERNVSSRVPPFSVPDFVGDDP